MRKNKNGSNVLWDSIKCCCEISIPVVKEVVEYLSLYLEIFVCIFEKIMSHSLIVNGIVQVITTTVSLR